MISSTMPSAKYSCSGSPLILANGSTAIDGLSGRGAPERACVDRRPPRRPYAQSETRTGRAMFLSCCSPMSSKARSSLPAASSCTRAETQIPPGSARPSRRAATLTPSPKMSPSSTTMSPTLMPMRNSMRLSGGTPALRPVIARCTSTAQRNASTTLPNSTSNPSPVVLTRRPWCSAIFGSSSSLAQRSEAFERALLIRPDQPRIARHIGREDRGETAGLAHVASPAARRRPDRNSSRSAGLRNCAALGTICGVIARSRATIARASSSRPIWA